jgi:type I restriction enzyme S subunit
MTRFGAAVRRVDERIPGIDLPLMSVSQTRGVIRRSELTDKPARAESLDVYKVCRRGDIVFNKMSVRAGALGVAPEDGLVTYHYEVMRPEPMMDARFLSYLMKSTWFIGELVKRERGIGSGDQANVRTTEVPFNVLKTVDVYLPSSTRQTAIADLLDRDTAQIDLMIEKQLRLIRTLRERQLSLVAGEVLAGASPLDGSTGRFPMIRLGVGYSVTLGKMLDAGKALRPGDTTLPYLRAANLSDSGLRLDDVKQMPFSPMEARELDIREGDVLVVEGGSVGTAVVIDRPMAGWSFQKTINRLRPIEDWDPRFVAYVLRTYRDVGFIDIVCNLATIPHLTAEKLRGLRVPVPDPVEQRRISDRIELQGAKVDALIERAERFIELARERRSALIAAAVTGQLDVGVAA